MATQRTSRVFTISFPPDLARKAEALAKRESRSISELFREAFRVYQAEEVRKTLLAIGDYAESRGAAHSENDVPRLIEEIRRGKAVRTSQRTRR